MSNQLDFVSSLYAEIYRQNYEDALDEIRELKFRIAELEEENARLRNASKETSFTLSGYSYY